MKNKLSRLTNKIIASGELFEIFPKAGRFFVSTVDIDFFNLVSYFATRLLRQRAVRRGLHGPIAFPDVYYDDGMVENHQSSERPSMQFRQRHTH